MYIGNLYDYLAGAAKAAGLGAEGDGLCLKN